MTSVSLDDHLTRAFTQILVTTAVRRQCGRVNFVKKQGGHASISRICGKYNRIIIENIVVLKAGRYSTGDQCGGRTQAGWWVGKIRCTGGAVSGRRKRWQALRGSGW